MALRPFLRLLTVCAVLVLSGTLSLRPAPAQDASPVWPTAGWPTATPESQGMDSAQLVRMLDDVLENDTNIYGMVITRHGYLVLEAYRYPFTPTTLHHIMSCTKSVVSALIGIALDEEILPGLDTPLLSLFPDRTIAELDARKQAITLEHLLTMTSGFDWPGGVDEDLLARLMVQQDWVQFVLDRPMSDDPGTVFAYNSGGSNLLAAILQDASGMTTAEFARQRLFEPLGITQWRWRSDPQGYTLGGWGLSLTPRDMAKFGYLYLRGGEWDGQQIVPAAWVAASTQKQVNARQLGPGYGYQWWIHPDDYALALGYGGQYIAVIPAYDLVVAFTSDLAGQDFFAPRRLIDEFIIPAALSDTPLPENAEAQAALQERVESLANLSG